jgi:cysteine desulfurase
MIDLDRAATAPVRDEVLQAMWPFLSGDGGNPSSRHERGRRAADALEWARREIAIAVGATSGEVIITAGATEADNLAVRGIALASPRGRRLVAAPTEHPAVLEACRALVRLHGFSLDLLPVDGDGMVNPREVATMIGDDVALVAVALASSETGSVQPIAEIAAVAHGVGAPVHCDAVQAIGQLPVDVRALGVDSLSLAGHKLGAPVGVGALIAGRSLPLEPLMYGGRQESQRRAGTENVAAAVGLAVALQLAVDGVDERGLVLAWRRDALRARIEAGIDGLVLVGHPERRLPGHLAWCVEGVESEPLLLRLDERGVLVSSGTACGEHADEPSEALIACGIPTELARGAIRLSFDDRTPVHDLDCAADVLIDAVERLRRLGHANEPSSAGARSG